MCSGWMGNTEDSTEFVNSQTNSLNICSKLLYFGS